MGELIPDSVNPQPMGGPFGFPPMGEMMQEADKVGINVPSPYESDGLYPNRPIKEKFRREREEMEAELNKRGETFFKKKPKKLLDLERGSHDQWQGGMPPMQFAGPYGGDEPWMPNEYNPFEHEEQHEEHQQKSRRGTKFFFNDPGRGAQVDHFTSDSSGLGGLNPISDGSFGNDEGDVAFSTEFPQSFSKKFNSTMKLNDFEEYNLKDDDDMDDEEDNSGEEDFSQSTDFKTMNFSDDKFFDTARLEGQEDNNYEENPQDSSLKVSDFRDNLFLDQDEENPSGIADGSTNSFGDSLASETNNVDNISGTPTVESTEPGPLTDDRIDPVTGLVRPRKQLKEKFMREREEMEAKLNAQGDSIYRRFCDPVPEHIKQNADPHAYGQRRISTAQEIRAQMALENLAKRALSAFTKKAGKGKGKGGRRGGGPKIVFI